MTGQNEIIEMTIQAGWTGIYSQWISPTERQHLTVPVTIEQIEAFAKLAAAKEREAIWNILFEYAGRDDLTPEDESLLKHLADLIKARGEA